MISECSLVMICSPEPGKKNNRKKEVEGRIRGWSTGLLAHMQRPTCPRNKTAHRASRCTCTLDGPYASDDQMPLENFANH